MRLAIVHDALVNLGGAERVVGVLHDIFPEAPIFTTVYLPERTHSTFRTAQIRTTLLQHVARSERVLKMLFPLTIPAIRSLDLSGYDVVLSSSTYCAKDIVVGPGVCHICYCYAPFRPVWEFDAYAAQLQAGRLKKLALRLFFASFKPWDFRAAQKPHQMIAISKHAAGKIQRAYRREATVIYPPVDVEHFPMAKEREDFFLVVSRLMSYKRIDIVVEAFRHLPYPLKIIGSGPDEARLRTLASPNVEFIGAASEHTLIDYYRRCRCLIFAGQEDFGLVPLEAHACGKPAIAFAAGGTLETVLAVNDRTQPGRPEEEATGVFFYERTPGAVIEAVRLFEKCSFRPTVARRQAEMFDKRSFKEHLVAFLERARERLTTRNGRAGTPRAETRS